MAKKIYNVLAVLAAVVIIAALVKGYGLPQVTAEFPEGEVAELTEITARDWKKLDTGTGVYYTIPESTSGAQVLELTSNWASMDVYLEDTLLYSFSDEYQELGRASHWIAIPEGSNGKRIILVSASGTAVATETLQSVNYLGTADAIRHRFFMKNLPVLLLMVVDVMMAIVVVLILAVLRHKLAVGLVQGIRDLLCFILLNGIWLISDCGFLECFTAKTGLWALISYIAYMLMPVFMVRFAQRLLTHRRKSLHGLGMASLVLTSASLILYLTRLAPLSTLLIFHQVITLLDYVAVYLLCDYEVRHYGIRRLMAVRDGVVLMGLLMLSGIMAYWKGLNTLYPLLISSGFTCYIVFLTISVVQQSFYNLGKKAETETYRRLAYKDVMTMVYNRSAFMEYQKTVSAGVRKSAYILFDVNGLKHVNDTMGHQAGDELIKQAAACIRETFEGIGNCYRIGGDEFMVVLGNIHKEKEVQNLLEHFEKQLIKSNRELAMNQPQLSIAYGYSLAVGDPRTSEEMYEEADEWMYSRKRSMKAREQEVG